MFISIHLLLAIEHRMLYIFHWIELNLFAIFNVLAVIDLAQQAYADIEIFNIINM